MGPTGFKLMFLGLMGAGVPVAIAMAGASLIYVMFSGNIPDFVVIHRMVNGVDSFPLLAVPFFILAGNLMNSAGITNRIYNFALGLVGWLKGGLGHVNVVGSVIFAGMSGTAILTRKARASASTARLISATVPSIGEVAPPRKTGTPSPM